MDGFLLLKITSRLSHCNQDKAFVKPNGPHQTVYCSKCGSFLYHVSKKEIINYIRLKEFEEEEQKQVK